MKIKRIFTIVLILLSILMAFSGCNNDDLVNVAKIDPYEIKNTNIKEDGCYILADFESYAECYDIFWGHKFGKIIQNKDTTYITRGAQSAKLEIYGRETWGGATLQPYMRIFTNNRFFQKSDFTDCDYLIFDIYNTMDYGLKLQVAITESTAISDEEAVSVELLPGWNNVMILISDLTENANHIDSFTFFFQRMNKENDEIRTVYIDNVRARIINVE